VANASESETLSMILTKVALSRDHVRRSIGAIFCLVRNVASQIADLLVFIGVLLTSSLRLRLKLCKLLLIIFVFF